MTTEYVLIIATAASIIISIVALFVAFDNSKYSLTASYDGTEPLSRNAVYTGGATLIALPLLVPS